MVTATAARDASLRRGRALEVFTILWNSAEGLVAVALGLVAGSIALVGFGVDSFIETSSGVALLWRLQARRDAHAAERAEATALRLVGLSLLALAAYIVYDAGGSLIRRVPPEASAPGIALAVTALAMVPLIAREGLEAWRGEHGA